MSADHLVMDGRSWKFLDHPERYCSATAKTDRELQLEPTRRQFRTAKAILQRLSGVGQKPVEGVLLADDVGLGKTTVASIVACVVARTGEHRVRVLAPNAVMKRRWEEELQAHIRILARLQPGTQIKLRSSETQRLHSGCIQVGTHHDLVTAQRNGQIRTPCDLLIIDEAHRAKGEKSAFRSALEAQGHLAASKLILTATPFSIAIQELVQLLALCGAADVEVSVKRYVEALHGIYVGPAGRAPDEQAKHLIELAREAMAALAPYVIRHGIESLDKAERRHFGTSVIPWDIAVPSAGEAELELLLRSDRLLRLKRKRVGQRTNDPRFHVGWKQLAHDVGQLESSAESEDEPVRKLREATLRLVDKHQRNPHPKMLAVAQATKPRVDSHEKVLVFCHHRMTALELLKCLDEQLRGPATEPRFLTREAWGKVWLELLQDAAAARELQDEHADVDHLREALCTWLSSDGIIRQVTSWLPTEPSTPRALRKALESNRVRRMGGTAPTVAAAADALFRNLTDTRSRSTLGKLRYAQSSGEFLPGTMEGGSRVLGAWQHSGEEEPPANLYQGQADIVLSIFNSPFGPDVLVTTDRFSEGVDLHRCCRLLVHYELDPSPIRTLQRNGRVRRVGSWASRTGQPIEYAFPAFSGTRDSKAVEIMSQRLKRFDLVLGGVPEVHGEQANAEAAGESFAAKVLQLCERELRTLNRKLSIAT